MDSDESLPATSGQPHEDGPSYYPTVATLSLGSHTVLHYYDYKSDTDSTESTSKGAIDQKPVASLLLEPRSLIITSSTFYKSRLHGIDAVVEDEFPPYGDT